MCLFYRFSVVRAFFFFFKCNFGEFKVENNSCIFFHFENGFGMIQTQKILRIPLSHLDVSYFLSRYLRDIYAVKDINKKIYR